MMTRRARTWHDALRAAQGVRRRPAAVEAPARTPSTSSMIRTGARRWATPAPPVSPGAVAPPTMPRPGPWAACRPHRPFRGVRRAVGPPRRAGYTRSSPLTASRSTCGPCGPVTRSPSTPSSSPSRRARPLLGTGHFVTTRMIVCCRRARRHPPLPHPQVRVAAREAEAAPAAPAAREAEAGFRQRRALCGSCAAAREASCSPGPAVPARRQPRQRRLGRASLAPAARPAVCRLRDAPLPWLPGCKPPAARRAGTPSRVSGEAPSTRTWCTTRPSSFSRPSLRAVGSIELVMACGWSATSS